MVEFDNLSSASHYIDDKTHLQKTADNISIVHEIIQTKSALTLWCTNTKRKAFLRHEAHHGTPCVPNIQFSLISNNFLN